MNFKSAFLGFLIVSFFALPSLAEVLPIDATKNAQSRNNSGVEFMKDRDYVAAIKEFKIAIAINPNHQTSAIYYNNLATAYLEIAKIQKNHGMIKESKTFAKYAEISLNDAIKQDCMQLSFYKNLVESFALQGNLKAKRKEYAKKTENPFNSIVVALIDEAEGNTRNMEIALDDFITTYPNLLISTALRGYLKEKAKN